MIYKLMTQDEYDTAKDDPGYKGSPLDVSSGFIHLSTQDQIYKTYETFFKDQDKILLLSFESDQFGDKLKWEKSPRSGKIYPHLYALLPLEKAKEVLRVSSETFEASLQKIKVS